MGSTQLRKQADSVTVKRLWWPWRKLCQVWSPLLMSSGVCNALWKKKSKFTYIEMTLNWSDILNCCSSIDIQPYVTKDSPTTYNITQVSKRNPGVSYPTDLDLKLLCDQCVTSLMCFLADEHTDWWFSKCCFSSDLSRGSEELSFHSLCFTLHQSLFSTHWTAYSVSLCLSFMAIRMCINPRGLRILHMCVPCSHLHYVCGGVSRDAVAYRGSPPSLVLLLLTHVSFHMSQNMFKLYMHTQTHAQSQSLSNSYTHTQQLFALPLRKLYNNNNSVCNNASNANPHRSKRRVSCGSSASHIKAMIEILASRQPAVFVYMCLSHTVMWNQMLPCEHPTGRKPTSAISRWILHY